MQVHNMLALSYKVCVLVASQQPIRGQYCRPECALALWWHPISILVGKPDQGSMSLKSNLCKQEDLVIDGYHIKLTTKVLSTS